MEARGNTCRTLFPNSFCLSHSRILSLSSPLSFSTLQDITIDVPKYRILGMHLMTGKLDWVLLKGMKVRGDGGKSASSARDRENGGKKGVGRAPLLSSGGIMTCDHRAEQGTGVDLHANAAAATTLPAAPPPPVSSSSLFSRAYICCFRHARAQVVSKGMGNDDYEKSDHKWLAAEVHLNPK